MSARAAHRLARHVLAAVVPVAAAAGLASCGGSSPAPTPPASADLVVIANNIAWDKSSYEVTTTGGKAAIALQNNDVVDHDLHLIAADGTDAGTVINAPARKSVLKDFNLKPGVYTMICTIAGHGNMKATVTVR